MARKIVLSLGDCSTVPELIASLQRLTAAIPLESRRNDVNYVMNGAGDPVTAELLETTLTDGSKTYDIIIR